VSKYQPIPLGVLFDTYAEGGQPTAFHLSRPFDIGPDAGTEHDIGALAGLVRSAAGWLHAAGARPGARVAIVKPNHWDYVLLACSAARLGAIPAMVSGRLRPEVLRILLERLDPSVLVTTAPILEAGERAGIDLAGLAKQVLTLDAPAPGAVHVADYGAADPPAARPRQTHEPMIITHTSGTTGAPKLVVHSADTIMGHLGRTESIRWPIVSMRREDTVATAIAFPHMRIIPWTTGTLRLGPRKALFVSGSQPDEAARLFAAHPPTYLEALPNTYLLWERLAESRAGAPTVFSRVRLYVSTFDAMHPPTIRRFLHASRHRFPVWLQGWGQSETGPLTFRLLTRRALARRGERNPTTRDVGRPIPFFTGLRAVAPETLRRVRPGRPGVVLVRTRGRCLDYVGERHRWQHKANGAWWNTGDVAVRTLTGKFRLLDREVDVIPGASCVEIEDILADRIPEVLEAVIIGLPGRPPVPVICTEDGRLDEARWAQATRDLPRLAAPVVLGWDDIPRTGTGKVRRPELRDQIGGDPDATFGTGQWT
jgi:acyl-coenzyme A synthetase/AMP-(fatty) acid ligase